MLASPRTAVTGLFVAAASAKARPRAREARAMRVERSRCNVNEGAYRTRVERLMAAPLADDATRYWPQSGEVLRGSARIAEAEARFRGLKLGVVSRLLCSDLIVVEWLADYGDGRIYRNVSLGEIRDAKVVRVTDYWGEPFAPPAWREGLSEKGSAPLLPDALSAS